MTIDWPSVYVFALVVYLPVVVGIFFAPSATTNLAGAKLVVYTRWFFETRVEKTHLSDGSYFFLSSIALLPALGGAALFAHHDPAFATNAFYVLFLVRTIAVLYWVLLFFSYALVSGGLTAFVASALIAIDLALVGVMAWSAATVDAHKVSIATAALLVLGACFFNDFLFIFVNTLLHLSWRRRSLGGTDTATAEGGGGVYAHDIDYDYDDDDGSGGGANEPKIDISSRYNTQIRIIPQPQPQQPQPQQQYMQQQQQQIEPLQVQSMVGYYQQQVYRPTPPMQQTFQPPVTTQWQHSTEYRRGATTPLAQYAANDFD